MQERKLHIAVACGGTGGHIFPGLATARVLRDRGNHVTIWLSGKGVENTALQGWKGPVVTVSSEGFQFGPLRSVLTGFKITWAVIRCLGTMIRHRPNVVLAMGSYSSVGPCFAARILRIPIVLHEANAVPGKAVRLLSRKAKAIGICFEESRYHLKGSNMVLTGMPLRSELFDQKSEKSEKSGTLNLLIMGGSAGARAINKFVYKAVCLLKKQSPELDIKVIHLTGATDEEEVRNAYLSAGVNAEVYAFVQQMALFYAKTDLAICRAGASSCAELGVFGVPALLIPYPYAASDHQTANANALERAGAADVIQQDDCTVEWLAGYISAQLENPERLEMMKKRAKRSNSKRSAEKLAELVEQCALK